MLTIVIPTKNRTEFLLRQLAYYSSVGFQGCISIGDSSDARHLKRTKQAIEVLGERLHIEHREYPELDVARCSQELMKLVATPYVAWCGDDDFIIPSSLDECIRFLEKSPDYSAAHGKAARIETRDSNPHGEIMSCISKTQPVREADSASQRFLHQMTEKNDVLFSVHRVESASLMFRDAHVIHDIHFAEVLLPNCLPVIRGKIKELDCLSLVRHMQDLSYYKRKYRGVFSWITNEKWPSCYQAVRDILTAELLQQDRITLEAAQEVVKQGFSIYLAKMLKRECMRYDPKYSVVLSDAKAQDAGQSEEQGKGILRSLRRRIGPRRISKRIRKLISPGDALRHEISLGALLNPSSPYHEDFMPVYDAVTSPPAEMGQATEMAGAATI